MGMPLQFLLYITKCDVKKYMKHQNEINIMKNEINVTNTFLFEMYSRYGSSGSLQTEPLHLQYRP